MIKFNTIGQIEHGEYPFEDAVAGADILNGDFGTVTDGEFACAATASKAVMQVEVGDDMGMDEYKITEGEHVRVVDLEKLEGKTVEIYGAQLPASYTVGDKLKSDAKGKLVTGATAAPYLEITKIIGNKLGVEATVVAKATATPSV